METSAALPIIEPALSRNRTVGYWLLGLCLMVLLMIILGGLTRLTHSGLSMVDWRPVTGWLPPLNAEEWSAIFELYKQTPQYLKINAGMTVDEFKSIFWLEYIHRLWGRIIGVAFAVPFLLFLARGWISRALAPKLILMFVLGGAQGVLGWLMVKSGLVDRPDVSQYRLTAHLALAIVIYGYMFWVALNLLATDTAAERHRVADRAGQSGLKTFTHFTTAWIFLTMISGGFVAGLDAGLTYNTFPLMDGELVPGGMMSETPWYLNLFENVTTVQFDHRILAESTFVFVLVSWFWARRLPLSSLLRRNFNWFGLMACLQVALGITTLIFVVPLPLAAAHQAGAFLLLTMGLWCLHGLSNPKGS